MALDADTLKPVGTNRLQLVKAAARETMIAVCVAFLALSTLYFLLWVLIVFIFGPEKIARLRDF